MYLRRLIIVILMILAGSFLIGKTFDIRYRKRWEYFFFTKPEEAVYGKENYDILFFGNSKIHSGLNPFYIDSVTKMSSYNFAVGSAEEQEMKMLATAYLDNHNPPKFVVIGVDNSMLIKYNILKERFVYLYYLQNDTIKKFMQQNGFATSLIKAAPFLKYSFFDEYNRTSLFTGKEKINGHFYKGFFNPFTELSADTTTITRQFYKTLPQAETINDTSAAMLRQTVELFQSKGTKVVFLYTPVKKIRKGGLLSERDSFFIKLENTYNIPVLYTDTSTLFEQKYFVDDYHLNKPGSRILSILVAEFIKKLH